MFKISKRGSALYISFLGQLFLTVKALLLSKLNKFAVHSVSRYSKKLTLRLRMQVWHHVPNEYL